MAVRYRAALCKPRRNAMPRWCRYSVLWRSAAVGFPHWWFRPRFVLAGVHGHVGWTFLVLMVARFLSWLRKGQPIRSKRLLASPCHVAR